MDTALLIDLSLILFGAVFGGLIAYRLKQPVVIGYIVAGLLLGSIASSFQYESTLVAAIAEIGVALLLFTLGLEFSLERLKKIGRPGVLGAVLQIVLTMAVFTILLPLLFGNTLLPQRQDVNIWMIALFLGGVISLSSTAVVAKLLSNRGDIESNYGELTITWLIVQGLAVVPLILILPVVSSAGSLSVSGILFSTLKSVAVIYIIFLLGRKLVPYAFKRLALFDNRELLLLSAFLFCIVIATGSYLVGLSFAVGAFISGMMLSTSAVSHEVFTEIRPLRDVFSSIFFVSLGFLIPFGTLFSNLFLALTLSSLIIVVKVVIILVLILAFNYHSKIAFLTSFALFQIGEFSFILAKIGLDRGIIDTELYQLILSTSIITLIITPLIFSNSVKIYKAFKSKVKDIFPFLYNYIFNLLDSDADMPETKKTNLKNHTILVGYGRVGKYIGKILEVAGLKYVVIDFHYKTLHDLRKKGVFSIYGDAVNREVLELAGMSDAKSIVIATPDVVSNELILKNVRKINPSAKIIARAHKEEDIARLSIRGVRDIIEPEFEASLKIGERILKYFDLDSSKISNYINKTREERRF